MRKNRKKFEEVEEYEIKREKLLKAISNDFGHKISTIEQAKIKLRRTLQVSEIYLIEFNQETNTFRINDDVINLPEGSKLTNTANIIGFCFEQNQEKVAQVDIEDNLFNGEFISSSNLAGDLSKLNQKILLETGIKTEFSFKKGFLCLTSN